MIQFIEDHRQEHGVEPICKVLPIAPSTYYERVAQRRDPARRSQRAQRDEVLSSEVKRVYTAIFGVYGARKVWLQLLREGLSMAGDTVAGNVVAGKTVARCTVERLMRKMGLAGAVRGKTIRTTHSENASPCPRDQVNRHFHAPVPNRLWLADFTDVATWSGFVYVAFVIDAYARRIVGWRVSRTAQTGFVLDALEQALHERQRWRAVGGAGSASAVASSASADRLVHHSDRGSQYVSIKYTEKLAAAGIEPSVGSVGDSYDNALAETVIGLYKTEVIRRRGRWRSLEAVEFATLEWVDWFNHRRLLGPIGNIPPAEAENRYYASLDSPAKVA